MDIVLLYCTLIKLTHTMFCLLCNEDKDDYEDKDEDEQERKSIRPFGVFSLSNLLTPGIQ